MGTIAMDTWATCDDDYVCRASRSCDIDDESEDDIWLFDPYSLDPSDISEIEKDVKGCRYSDGHFDSDLWTDNRSRPTGTTPAFGTIGRLTQTNGNSTTTTGTDCTETETALQDNGNETDKSKCVDDKWELKTEDIRMLDPEAFMAEEETSDDKDNKVLCDGDCICTGRRSIVITETDRTFKAATSLRNKFLRRMMYKQIDHGNQLCCASRCFQHW